MSNKRPSSPTEISDAGPSAPEPKRSKAAAAPLSLHAWLHPSEPEALIAQSPALHSSSSTFLSFTISFEPGSHVTTEPTLAKEARRIVRELDVVKLVGSALLHGGEGAFQNGEGRAAGPGTGKGKERAREPDHRMWAVRTLCLKEGKDGTKGEDDYQLLESFNDDGEKFGGERVMRALRENNGVDVLTVCCRWYGGDMIGPIRFQHIAVTTQTSLKALLKLVALRDLRTTLEALDEEVSSLRSALADIPKIFPPDPSIESTSTPNGNGVGIGNRESASATSQHTNDGQMAQKEKEQEKGKYDAIDDTAKLERLVKAKEKTRDTLQTKLGSAIS